MAVSLPDTRSLPDVVLNFLRLLAIRGCQKGYTQQEMAELLEVDSATVCHWWSSYSTKGIDGLPGDRTGRPKGSGCILSDEQSTHLQQLIDHNNPETLGIAAPLWNRRAVQQLIRKETGIGMSVRTVGEYLKRWGYTCKKPSRRSRKQDPKEVKEWLEETYPALEKQAQNEGAEILWGDETGVAADAFPGYGYARKGERAIMDVPDPHIKANLISAISNQGTIRFMTYYRTMNADLYLKFLKGLLRNADRKIYLIVDHLRAHDAIKVWDWVNAHKQQIKMVLMPRRSPEMNADEYLNNDLKGNIHAQGFPSSKEELRQRIQKFLRGLVHWPTHIMNYFHHPSAVYASGT